MDAIARMKVELETKKRRMAEISASQDSEAAAAPGAAVKKKYMTKGQAKQLQVLAVESLGAGGLEKCPRACASGLAGAAGRSGTRVLLPDI